MCSDFGRGSAHLFESPANDIVPISVRRAVILRGSTEQFGFIASVELLQLDPSRGNQRKHGGSFVGPGFGKFLILGERNYVAQTAQLCEGTAWNVVVIEDLPAKTPEAER